MPPWRGQASREDASMEGTGLEGRRPPWRGQASREGGLHGGDRPRGLCIHQLHRQARARAPRSGDTTPAPAWMRLAPEAVVALELLGYTLQGEGHSVIQQTLYAGCTVA